MQLGSDRRHVLPTGCSRSQWLSYRFTGIAAAVFPGNVKAGVVFRRLDVDLAKHPEGLVDARDRLSFQDLHILRDQRIGSGAFFQLPVQQDEALHSVEGRLLMRRGRRSGLRQDRMQGLQVALHLRSRDFWRVAAESCVLRAAFMGIMHACHPDLFEAVAG